MKPNLHMTRRTFIRLCMLGALTLVGGRGFLNSRNLELVKLRGIGRMRARALHSRGISSIEHLRQTSYDRLKQIPNIGESVARSIKSQLGQSDDGIPPDPASGQKSLKEF